LCQGHGCDLQKGKLVVVTGDPVGLEHTAGGAAVDDGPFPAGAAPDGDRLHGGFTA